MDEVEHHTVVVGTPDGYLPSCKCGWRYPKFVPYGTAIVEADKHEIDAKNLRLNIGSRPGPKSAAAQFRKNSENPVYSEEERTQWLQLAIELEVELEAKKKGPIEGQIALPFD